MVYSVILKVGMLQLPWLPVRFKKMAAGRAAAAELYPVIVGKVGFVMIGRSVKMWNDLLLRKFCLLKIILG